MCWRSRNPDETRALAQALATVLRDEPGGFVVSLVGPLGAGKTQFAKGLAVGFGLRERDVTSPTFVLANEWPLAEGRLVHADWYRVESDLELEAAGLADWLEPGTGFVVEWGDRFPEALPADHLCVRFAPCEGDPEARDLRAEAGGPRSEAWLAQWRTLSPAEAR
jgi:tRNA threonylcarbamoyladenosine biosynthesis protein TsaE